MEKHGLLFETIFKRKLTDSDVIPYLEQLTKEHPYFSIAQFYLLGLSQKNVNGYKTQAKKTGALFNNNHWLNFQLSECPPAYSESTPLQATPFNHDKVWEADPVPVEILVKEEDAIVPATNELPAIETPLLPDETTGEELAETIAQEESGPTEPVIANEPIINNDTDIAKPIYEPVLPIENVQEEKDEAAIVMETTAETDTVVFEPVEEQEPAAALPAAEIDTTPAAPVTDIESPEEALPLEQVVTTEEKEVIDTAEEETAAPTVNEAAIQLNIPGPVDAVTITDPLLFEPLHTTDYFASVGIKLSEEEKSSDKLGKQLKSFTEWLKTMKRVHAEQRINMPPPPATPTHTENSIQKMAEKSNLENEIVTETMAEVWVQQGKDEKAIEILEKLSLLNPGKSAYFAAKINQIKEK